MTYAQQTWANGLGGGTALSASRLNHMEVGISAADAANDSLAALAATVASMQAAVSALQSNFLTTGDEVFPRAYCTSNAVTLTSGTIRFTLFTAKKTQTTASFRTSTGSSGTGTPTTCIGGLYTVDGTTGDFTRIAQSTHDAALWVGANNPFTKAWAASASVTKGLRYAFGLLFVGGTAPNLTGLILTGSQSEYAQAPRISAALTGQTNMPSTITAASLATNGQLPYGVLL